MFDHDADRRRGAGLRLEEPVTGKADNLVGLASGDELWELIDAALKVQFVAGQAKDERDDRTAGNPKVMYVNRTIGSEADLRHMIGIDGPVIHGQPAAPPWAFAARRQERADALRNELDILHAARDDRIAALEAENAELKRRLALATPKAGPDYSKGVPFPGLKHEPSALDGMIKAAKAEWARQCEPAEFSAQDIVNAALARLNEDAMRERRSFAEEWLRCAKALMPEPWAFAAQPRKLLPAPVANGDDVAFLEGMSQTHVQPIWYGNPKDPNG